MLNILRKLGTNQTFGDIGQKKYVVNCEQIFGVTRKITFRENIFGERGAGDPSLWGTFCGLRHLGI
mgnify:CR=1 FL=1